MDSAGPMARMRPFSTRTVVLGERGAAAAVDEGGAYDGELRGGGLAGCDGEGGKVGQLGGDGLGDEAREIGLEALADGLEVIELGVSADEGDKVAGGVDPEAFLAPDEAGDGVAGEGLVVGEDEWSGGADGDVAAGGEDGDAGGSAVGKPETQEELLHGDGGVAVDEEGAGGEREGAGAAVALEVDGGGADVEGVVELRGAGGAAIGGEALRVEVGGGGEGGVEGDAGAAVGEEEVVLERGLAGGCLERVVLAADGFGEFEEGEGAVVLGRGEGLGVGGPGCGEGEEDREVEQDSCEGGVVLAGANRKPLHMSPRAERTMGRVRSLVVMTLVSRVRVSGMRVSGDGRLLGHVLFDDSREPREELGALRCEWTARSVRSSVVMTRCGWVCATPPKLPADKRLLCRAEPAGEVCLLPGAELRACVDLCERLRQRA